MSNTQVRIFFLSLCLNIFALCAAYRVGFKEGVKSRGETISGLGSNQVGVVVKEYYK